MRQRMRRRDFIACILLAGAATTAPLAARGQTGAKTRRVGVVVEGMRSAAYDGFLQGMSELGYMAGRDYLVEWRFADGRYLRILDLVSELTRLNTDVIFVGSPAIVYPVRQATRTIPIVMGYSIDPVGNGFVSSLDHPGGNITGLASSEDTLAGKQMELLATLVPALTRVALLQNPEGPNAPSILKHTQAAARKAGVDLVPLDASAPQDVEDAFRRISDERIQAIVVASDRFFLSDESLRDFYRRAASFVDRIFKGAKPADLPIEQPALFELTINRRTAAALGVAIPPSAGFVAYQVIE
jgi:putative ABC transport system substrate-binding protein